jgi:hypothetical protein
VYFAIRVVTYQCPDLGGALVGASSPGGLIAQRAEIFALRLYRKPIPLSRRDECDNSQAMQQTVGCIIYDDHYQANRFYNSSGSAARSKLLTNYFRAENSEIGNITINRRHTERINFYSANKVLTPSLVPSKSTSAGLSANSPLVTTPVMLLILASIANGCGIEKLYTSRMTFPLSVTTPSR